MDLNTLLHLTVKQRKYFEASGHCVTTMLTAFVYNESLIETWDSLTSTCILGSNWSYFVRAFMFFHWIWLLVICFISFLCCTTLKSERWRCVSGRRVSVTFSFSWRTVKRRSSHLPLRKSYRNVVSRRFIKKCSCGNVSTLLTPTQNNLFIYVHTIVRYSIYEILSRDCDLRWGGGASATW